MKEHGTTYAYGHGCRCTECRRANTERQKRWRYTKRDTGETPTRFAKQFDQPTFEAFVSAGSWVDDALCTGRGNEWLVTENQQRANNPRRFTNLAAALDGCAACPVLEPCGRWVMSHVVDPCPWHVVAGMTPRQRNQQRRDFGLPTPGRHITGEVA